MSGPAEQASLTGPEVSRLRHDLRTPVNAILGYSEILIEDAPERAAELGGETFIENSPSGGTRVRARLPIGKE